MSHTPGPWKASENPDLTDLTIQVFAGGEVLAVADRRNARLIAAAPDLLTAGEAVLDHVLGLPTGVYQPFHREAEALRAAIAKAKGEA